LTSHHQHLFLRVLPLRVRLVGLDVLLVPILVLVLSLGFAFPLGVAIEGG
jgi:hypothetical protein